MLFNDIKSIKVYRNSGRPVDVNDEQRYVDDWKLFYDKAADRAKLDMMKLDRYLSFGAFVLQKKHYKPTFVNSFSELANMYLQLGYPLLIGVDSGTNELIAVLQDS